MGMGNAFAALTDGWFGGVNQRHAWEDRAKNHKRQEKLDTYYDEEFGWRREENERNKTRFGWDAANQADADRARDLIFADDQARRADGQAAVAAADAAYGGGMGIRPAGVSTQGSVATLAAEPAAMGAPALPQGARPAAVAGPASSERSLSPAERARTQDGRLLPPLDPSGRPYTIQPGAAGGQASQEAGVEPAPVEPAPVARAAADAPAQDAGGLTILEDGTVIPPSNRSLTAEERAVVAQAAKDGKLRPAEERIDAAGRANDKGAAGMLGDARGSERSLVGDLSETAGAADYAIRSLARDSRNMVTGMAENTANAMRRADGYILGREPVGIREVDPKATGALLESAGRGGNRILDAFGVGHGKPAADKSAVPAADPKKPATQEAASTAAGAMEQTPSGQAVTAVAQGMGVSPSTKQPAEAREHIVGTWMDQFQEQGMPIIVRGMMERGEYDAAQKMQEWADTAAAKTGLRHWANAGLAASIGDFDAFADNLAAAYNTSGYFDDGYSMIREKSDFIRTPEGDVAGAVVTFRDDATGREFQQQFDSADDLLQAGIQLLSPEAVMEHLLAQQTAQTEALRAAADKAEAEAKDLTRRIDSIAKTIFDSANKNALPGDEGMSYADARAQAALQLGVEPEGMAGGAPIYARVPK